MFDAGNNARQVATPLARSLVIVIPHTLGKAEALRRLQPGLTALAGNAPMFTVEQETWNGEELTFRVRALGDQKKGPHWRVRAFNHQLGNKRNLV